MRSVVDRVDNKTYRVAGDKKSNYVDHKARSGEPP